MYLTGPLEVSILARFSAISPIPGVDRIQGDINVNQPPMPSQTSLIKAHLIVSETAQDVLGLYDL
jgi:hypothetical protein